MGAIGCEPVCLLNICHLEPETYEGTPSPRKLVLKSEHVIDDVANDAYIPIGMQTTIVCVEIHFLPPHTHTLCHLQSTPESSTLTTHLYFSFSNFSR